MFHRWHLACSEYSVILFFFFFNDTATTEIYTLSLHDALPIDGVGAHDRAPTRLAPAGGAQTAEIADVEAAVPLKVTLIVHRQHDSRCGSSSLARSANGDSASARTRFAATPRAAARRPWNDETPRRSEQLVLSAEALADAV